MKYANFGTISHGTLRNEDLLDSFASELESLNDKNHVLYQTPNYEGLVTIARNTDPESDQA